MTPITAAQAFADVSSALVGDHDIAGTLADLLTNCASLVSADACGLLVADGDTGLQLLAATSHEVSELELYQAQIVEGPCIEAWSNGVETSAFGTEAITSRWERFGLSMVDAGFHAVFAAPLRWHDKSMGALNLFRNSATELTAEEKLLVRAFADFATILIVHTDHIAAETAIERARSALASRVQIEQAKGVLSHQHNLDMAAAYVHLKQLALDEGVSLTAMAAEVLLRAQQR